MAEVISGFDTFVECYNTPGHVVIFAAAEARLFHHVLECFLVWVHAYGFREILVAVGVIGHQSAHQWQHAERVCVIGFAEQGVVPKIEELEGQQLVNLFLLLLLALPPAFDTVLEEGCENQIQQAACDLWPTQVKFIGNLTVELCDYRDFVDCAKDAIATFRVRDKRFIKFNPEHHKILYNMVEP